MQFLTIASQFVLVVLLADFASGLIHWAEDAYGEEDTPIIGPWVTQANVLHHRQPRAFLQKNWWQSSWDLLLFNSLLVLAAWFTGHLTWHVWLFAALGANANQIHKWAHRTPRENGRLVTLLQRCRLIQTTRHHARHHTNPKNSNYCTITDFLNPVLDGGHFWEGIEYVLLGTLGLRRRIDPTVKPRKPAPAPSRQSVTISLSQIIGPCALAMRDCSACNGACSTRSGATHSLR